MKDKHVTIQAKKEFVLTSRENNQDKLRLTEKVIILQWGGYLFVGEIPDVNKLSIKTLEHTEFKNLSTDSSTFSYPKVISGLQNVPTNDVNKDFFDLLETMLNNYSNSKEITTWDEIYGFMSSIQENTEISFDNDSHTLAHILKDSSADKDSVLHSAIEYFKPILQELINDSVLFSDVLSALSA